MALAQSIGQRFAVDDALRTAGVDITGIDAAELKQVQRLVGLSIDRGWADETLAQRLKPVLGLGPRYMQAVDTYRQGLLAKEVPPGKADKMANDYANRLRAQRAMTVAKYERETAIAKGNIESWRRLQKSGRIGARAVRIFRAHKDCCSDCKKYNGRRVSLQKDDLIPPLHPNCRCSTELSDQTIAKYSTRGMAGRGKKLFGFHRPGAKHLRVPHVRTHAGSERFHAPIGTPIVVHGHDSVDVYEPEHLDAGQLQSRMDRAKHIRERQIARRLRHPLPPGPQAELLPVPHRAIPPFIHGDVPHVPDRQPVVQRPLPPWPGESHHWFRPSDGEGDFDMSAATAFDALFPSDNTFPPPGNTWSAWYMDKLGDLHPVADHESAAEEVLVGDHIDGTATEQFMHDTGYVRIGYLPLPWSTDEHPAGDMYVEFGPDMTDSQATGVVMMLDTHNADVSGSISSIADEEPWLLQVGSGELMSDSDLFDLIAEYRHENKNDAIEAVVPKPPPPPPPKPKAPPKPKRNLHPIAKKFYKIDYLVPATPEQLNSRAFKDDLGRRGEGWWEAYMDDEGKVFAFPVGITHGETARRAGAYGIEDFLSKTGFIRIGNFNSNGTTSEFYGEINSLPNEAQLRALASFAELKNDAGVEPSFGIVDDRTGNFFRLQSGYTTDDVHSHLVDWIQTIERNRERFGKSSVWKGVIAKLGRRVRTPAGVRHYGEPIGAAIAPNRFVVRVDHATNDQIQAGDYEHDFSVVSILANNENDATLTASQIVASTRDAVPTRTTILATPGNPLPFYERHPDAVDGMIPTHKVTTDMLVDWGIAPPMPAINDRRDTTNNGWTRLHGGKWGIDPMYEPKFISEAVRQGFAFHATPPLDWRRAVAVRKQEIAKRKVRTAAGVKRFGVPIGTTITAAQEAAAKARQASPFDGSGSKAKLKADKPKPAAPKIEVGGDDSLTKYVHDGVVDPERAKLHDKIVSGLLAGQQKSADPTIVFMGGGPASGKSTALGSSGHVGVKIDTDEIKGELPEYVDGMKKKDTNAANYVHEESSLIAKRAQAEALDAGFDVTLDGTGDSDITKLRHKVEQARKSGYKVKGAYVTVDTEEAIRRSDARGAETGRIVPHVVIREIHSAVTDTLVKAIAEDLFDELELWDTNGGKPVLVGQKPAGGKWEVQDQAAWDAFLAKGKADRKGMPIGEAKMAKAEPPADNRGEVVMKMLQSAAAGGDFPEGVEHTPDNDALWQEVVDEVKAIADAGQVVDVPFDWTTMPDDAGDSTGTPPAKPEGGSPAVAKGEPVMTPGRDGMPYSGITSLIRRRRKRKRVRKWDSPSPYEVNRILRLHGVKDAHLHQPKGTSRGGQFAPSPVVGHWRDELRKFPRVKKYIRKGGFFIDTDGEAYDVQFHIPAVGQITGDSMTVGAFLRRTGVVRMRATSSVLDVSFMRPMSDEQMARIAKELGSRELITNIDTGIDGFRGTPADTMAYLRRLNRKIVTMHLPADIYGNMPMVGEDRS